MDTEGEEFGALGAELGERDPADAGQRANRLGDFAFGHEEGLDEVAGFDDRLAEHGTDAGRSPEAAEADGLIEGGRHRRVEIGGPLGQGNGEACPGGTLWGGTLCHPDPIGTGTGICQTFENHIKTRLFPWHKPCQ